MARVLVGRLVAVLVAVTALMLGWAPPSGADPAGHFLDDQPVVIDLTNPTADPVAVGIINTGSEQVTYTLTVVGNAAPHLHPSSAAQVLVAGASGSFTLRVDAEPPPTTGTLVLTGSDGTLERLAVKLVGVAPQEPGVLIPGTFEQLKVSAVSAVPSFVRPVPAQNQDWWLVVVGVAIVAVLGVLAYRRQRAKDSFWAFVASILALLGLTAALLVVGVTVAQFVEKADPNVPEVSNTVAPPNSGRSGATLAGDTGGKGLLVSEATTLTISGLDRAGNYTGTVDTQPSGGGGEIKTTVTVHDHWGWAVAAVTVGVLIGFLVSVLYAQRRRNALHSVAVAKVRREVASRESQWLLGEGDQPWASRYRIHDYVKQHLDGLSPTYASDPVKAETDLSAIETFAETADSTRVGARAEIENAMELRSVLQVLYGDAIDRDPAWLSALVDEPNPLFVPGQSVADSTTRVTQLSQTARTAAATRMKVVAVAESLSSLRDTIGERAAAHCDVTEVTEEWEALGPRLVESSSEAEVEAVRKTAAELQKKVEALQPSAIAPPLVADQHAAIPQAIRGLDEAGSRVRDLIRHLKSLEVPPEKLLVDRDDLVMIRVSAILARDNERYHWEFSDNSTSSANTAEGAAGEVVELEVQHMFTDGPKTLEARVVSEHDRQVLGRWTDTADTAVGRLERARRALSADDRFLLLVAFVLAVGSGLVALYVPDATWGTAGDYLTALLWGAVTAEAIKQVATLIQARGQTQ